MAIHILKIPQLGEGLTQVEIVEIYLGENTWAAKDQVIYAVETDKATVDIENPHEGYITAWHAAKGDVVEVGAAIATLRQGDPEGTDEYKPADNAPKIPEVWPTHTDQGVFITPRIRAYCKKRGMSRESLKSLQCNSQTLTIELVDKFLCKENDPPTLTAEQASTNPGPGTYTIRSLTQQQKRLCNHFKRSSAEVVPASLVGYVDLRSFKEANKQLISSYTPSDEKNYFSEFQLFAYWISRVVADFPKFRSTLINDDEFKEHDHSQLGFAVQTDEGELVTAVIDDADTLPFAKFHKTFNDKMQQAKYNGGSNQTSPDMQLVLSHMGSSNVLFGSPLLVAPAVATLFFCIPGDERQKNDGRIYLSMTFDHRLLNGMEVVAFFAAVNEQILRNGKPETLQEYCADNSAIATAVHEVDAPVCPVDKVQANPSGAKQTVDVVELLITKEVSEILNLSVDRVDKNESLGIMGVDSIKLMDLKDRLERKLNLSLPATIFWHHPTICLLAQHLVIQFTPKLSVNSTADKLQHTNHNEDEVVQLLQELQLLSRADRLRILSEIIA